MSLPLGDRLLGRADVQTKTRVSSCRSPASNFRGEHHNVISLSTPAS